MPDVDQVGLWRQWQDNSDEGAYDQLITSLDPLIRYQLNKWAANPINKTVLRAEAYSLVRDALPNYDPSRGAMSTHVMNSMKPLHRFTTKYQNPVSIPERLAGEFGKVKGIESELRETLGRRPTVNEIAVKAKMSADKIERIRSGMATSVPLSAVLDEGDESGQTYAAMRSVADRNIHRLRAELKGRERQVFDFIQREAVRNKGTVSLQAVADAYGMDVADVYAYKSAWTRRLKNVGV